MLSLGQTTASRRLTFDLLRSYAAASLGALNSHREDSCPADEVPATCLSALAKLKRYLNTAPPRSLRAGFVAPILLFTDGAVEFSTGHHTPHDWPGLSASGGSTAVPSCLAVAGQLGRNDDGPGRFCKLRIGCGSVTIHRFLLIHELSMHRL